MRCRFLAWPAPTALVGRDPNEQPTRPCARSSRSTSVGSHVCGPRSPVRLLASLMSQNSRRRFLLLVGLAPRRPPFGARRQSGRPKAQSTRPNRENAHRDGCQLCTNVSTAGISATWGRPRLSPLNELVLADVWQFTRIYRYLWGAHLGHSNARRTLQLALCTMVCVGQSCVIDYLLPISDDDDKRQKFAPAGQTSSSTQTQTQTQSKPNANNVTTRLGSARLD